MTTRPRAIQADITTLESDAMVTATSGSPPGFGVVDGANREELVVCGASVVHLALDRRLLDIERGHA